MIKKIISKILHNQKINSQNLAKQNSLTVGNILSANILHKMNMQMLNCVLENIQRAEFKVFSQWGDDGIIQFLIDYLNIEEKSFVEFGVENYTEANTKFLLINNNWKGLIFDASQKHIEEVKSSELYWKFDLKASREWITRENINQLISSNGFTGMIGLLSIDIDGNDYWIWNEINVIDPQIVIVEYNSSFGPDNPWTISYKSNFEREKAHYSNLYYGTSLTSICDLAEKKGYSFIGSNSNGNNAYFVKNNRIKGLKKMLAQEGYVESSFRESRSSTRELSFLKFDERIELLKGMDIYNTRSNKIEQIQ